jgi:hypothetical protein
VNELSWKVPVRSRPCALSRDNVTLVSDQGGLRLRGAIDHKFPFADGAAIS